MNIWTENEKDFKNIFELRFPKHHIRKMGNVTVAKQLNAKLHTFCKYLQDIITSADISGIHQLHRQTYATHISSLPHSLRIVAFGTDKAVNSSRNWSLKYTSLQEYLWQSTKVVHIKNF